MPGKHNVQDHRRAKPWETIPKWCYLLGVKIDEESTANNSDILVSLEKKKDYGIIQIQISACIWISPLLLLGPLHEHKSCLDLDICNSYDFQMSESLLHCWIRMQELTIIENVIASPIGHWLFVPPKVSYLPVISRYPSWWCHHENEISAGSSLRVVNQLMQLFFSQLWTARLWIYTEPVFITMSQDHMITRWKSL